MADRVGASPPHIRDVEQGNRRPSDELLKRIAIALDVQLEELLKHSTRPPAKQMEELIEKNTEYSLAFRKFVEAVRDKKVPPADIVDLSEKLPNNP